MKSFTERNRLRRAGELRPVLFGALGYALGIYGIINEAPSFVLLSIALVCFALVGGFRK